MTYRLGLDLGTNSIGWSAVKLNHNGYPEAMQDAGVRIFSDGRAPKTGTSLAAERTVKRGMRRRRDRFTYRRNALLEKLTALGLLPQNAAGQKALSALNPYQLRAEGLDRPLSAHELGRVLLHLNQRRGFKSNRKQGVSEDQGDIGALKAKLNQSNSRTLGEFLYKEWQKNGGLGTTRARKGEGLYPERAHYAHEFAELQKAQQKHHSLTEQDWATLEHIIFHQRDLAKQPRGKCQLMYKAGKERADAALPSAEMFVALQNLNNLGWREKGSAKAYTMLRDHSEKWQKLWEKLQNQKSAPAFKTVANTIGIDYEAYEFNLEAGGKREKLETLKTATLLSEPQHFGNKWPVDIKEQDRIAQTIFDEQDPEKLAEILQKEWGLAAKNAKTIAALDDSKFKSGTARFCEEAFYGMLPYLLEQKTYWEAAEALGYDTRGESPDNTWDYLPYYAEALPDVAANAGKKRGDKAEQDFGIIGNPTVHIALNQLRKVVNELIDLYGKPESIHIELARDLKMTKDQKAKLEKKQRGEQKINEVIAKELENIAHKHGIVVENTYTNRLRYKLWQEQDHTCPFSGAKIGISRLFSHDFEIEHILPFSQTLDDSPANKVLATKAANQKKGNRAPFEAFGHEMAGDYAYELILARLENMKDFPANKRWRFAPEAMAKFADESGFLKRQLHDTQYLSKVAARYLSCICPKNKVVASPGRLTAKLRHHWGLNSIIDDNASEKDRTDHRHHAIDALVVALTDTRTLQRAATANKTVGINDDRLHFPCPIDEQLLREQAKTVIGENLVVAHRIDHGTQGQLHEDTNYGIFTPRTAWEHEKAAAGYNAVVRKALVSLSDKEIDDIRDPLLREEVTRRLGHAQDAKERLRILEVFVEQRKREGKPLNSVRVLKKDNSIKPIKHVDSVGTEHIKHVAPGDNHHVAFWQLPDGATLRDEVKQTNRFIELKNGLVAEPVSVFDANQKQPENDPRPHPAAKLLMRLHRGDIVQLEEKNELRIVKIKSLITAGKQITYSFHNAAGKTPDGGSFTFNGIESKKVRKLYVTPAGKILNARPRD